MNPQLDLYGNIGEIRDALDTLLKRGKPASVADLQALIATVEAKSRPTLTKAAESVPRSVPVDFLQGWRWPAALAVTPLAVTLLFLWIGGAFSGVSQAKYESQRAVAQELADEREFYRTEIDAFSKDMQRDPASRKLAKTYFSKYVPLPPAKIK